MVGGGHAKTATGEWALGNPWLWGILGLALCALAWLLTRLGVLADVVVPLIVAGLLACASAIAIRLNSTRGPFLDPPARRARGTVLLGLTLLFGLIAFGVSVVFLFSLPSLVTTPVISQKPGQMFIIWLVTAPMSALACAVSFRGLQDERGYTERHEGAALLALASLAAFIGCWALYDPTDPGAWDTFRLFIGVLVFVSVVAAPLVVVSQTIRRLVVSLLIVLHFGGIATAAMSVPPSPWLVGQVWTRIYRPYLEFMYLNNAYHFYSPDPGPPNNLWFYVFYHDEQDILRADWVKIPTLDTAGRHDNVVSLEYQRMMALTENVVGSEPAPPTHVNGKIADWYARRVLHSPHVDEADIIGLPRVDKNRPTVPFHPFVNHQGQYMPPAMLSKQMYGSYARHVCHAFQEKYPERRVKSVKIYRLIHLLPDVKTYADGLDARDPEWYRHYYIGEHDPDGVVRDTNDPFLYWLLPTLRDPNTNFRTGPATCYALKHAGDPAYRLIYNPKDGQYHQATP